MSDLCPVYAPFFSAMGNGSYGTAKSDQMMKCVVPSWCLRWSEECYLQIYGLVVSVLIASDLAVSMSLAQGFVQLGAGLSVGLAGLAAGFAIGIQPRLFVGMILILIFAEVLGLYGLIVALIMNTKSQGMTLRPVLRTKHERKADAGGAALTLRRDGPSLDRFYLGLPFSLSSNNQSSSLFVIFAVTVACPARIIFRIRV
ncbi:hypothetical protein B0H13DRAFT_2024837 [Mycena leptocephala]|nr:hypothetical protein B0H13DRAFT_2024837 [Mycena leptocephala]